MRIKFRTVFKDDGQFKESEHPRGPDGKFTATMAGGNKIQSGITFPKEGSLSNKIWHMAHYHQNKHEKAITPPELSQAAQSFGMNINKNTLNTQLAQYKKWAANHSMEEGAKGELPPVQKAQGAKPAAQPKPKKPVVTKKEPLENSTEKFVSILSKIGFEKEGDFNGMPYYQTPDEKIKISYSPQGKSWQMKKEGEVVAKGDTMESLQEALMNHVNPENLKVNNPSIFKPEPSAKIQKPTPGGFSSATSYAQYKHSSKFEITSHGIADSSSMPPALKASLKAYTGSGYTEINNAMRFSENLDNVDIETLKNIVNIQKAFAIAPPTTKDCTLYRHVQMNALETMCKSAGLTDLSELQPGAIIEDYGVVSTSHNTNAWSGNVAMTIKLPKGSKAINVTNISHHTSENETVLPPGSKFKILKYVNLEHSHKMTVEVI